MLCGNSPTISDSPSTDAFSQQAAWNSMYQRPTRVSTHTQAQDRPLTCTLFAAGQTPRLQAAAMLASLGRPRASSRACWGSLFGIHPIAARIDDISNCGCVPPSKGKSSRKRSVLSEVFPYASTPLPVSLRSKLSTKVLVHFKVQLDLSREVPDAR